MRKFLPLLILVSLIVMISSCDQSKVTVYVDGGYAYKVDTAVMNQYGEIRVKLALQRDRRYSQENLPVNASNFGPKKAEFNWRAFVYDLRTLNNRLEKGELVVSNWKEVGIVTVVHYEKGLEIIKDGQHWYYDGYDYDEDNIHRYSGGLSKLHSPRWEPVKVGDNGWKFEYDYPKDNNCLEIEHFYDSDGRYHKVNCLSDLFAR